MDTLHNGNLPMTFSWKWMKQRGYNVNQDKLD